MKKFLLLVAVAAGVVSANAQERLAQSKFFDNWSVGVNVGGITPTTNFKVIDNTRLSYGVELRKDFSPAFGLSVGAQGYSFGDHQPKSHAFAGLVTNKAIDLAKYRLAGNFNLSNIFCGYKGAPRFFEVEAVAAAGLLHGYNGDIKGLDVMQADFGLNFLFNLGKSRAFAVKVSPSIGYQVFTDENLVSHGDLNINRSVLEANVGLVYRFKTSNGTNNFALESCKQVDEAGLNATINSLRGQLNGKTGELSQAQAQIRSLQQQLNEARNQKPATIVETKTNTNRTLESMVHYRIGKSNIELSQMPNVERVAIYLKKNPSAKAIVRGYASTDGNADFNKKLSIARAESVKNALVKKYKIAADRITTEGQGSVEMFEQAEWNRVSITTIDAGK